MSERATAGRAAPRRIYDGFHSLEGGVDTGVAPHMVAENQVVWSINATVRNGTLRSRPGFQRHALVFEDDETKTTVDDAIWQCAIAYLSDSQQGSLVFAKGGRLYKISVETPTQLGMPVQDVSPVDANNASNLNVGWMVQAENFVVFQDNQSTPIIFNGAGSNYAASNQIKTGSVMSYQNGRIWYSVGPTGKAFRATDLVNSSSQWKRSSVLYETENTFLNEGGDFAVPHTSGPITAMGSPAQLDTSLGQGPLQIFTTNAVFSINAPTDRNIWKDVTYPIQTFSLLEQGAVSPRWMTAVNGDMWYRSPDGVRSFIVARRNFSEPGNTPQSSEMSRAFDFDNRGLLGYGSSVVFDNRLLGTAGPRKTTNGSIVHDYIAVLDFQLVSGLRRKLPIAWEGIWTGVSVLQIVKGWFAGRERCFLFVDDDGELQLWEVTLGNLYDNPDAATNVRIASAVETRAMDFDNPYALKTLDIASIWVEELNSAVDFQMQFKPDDYPCWIDWYSWSECQDNEQCFPRPARMCCPDECRTIKNYRPGYRPKMRLPQAPETCNDVARQPMNRFFECQFRLSWTGHASFSRGIFVGIDTPETVHGECLGTSECRQIECCDQVFEYDSNGNDYV